MYLLFCTHEKQSFSNLERTVTFAIDVSITYYVKKIDFDISVIFIGYNYQWNAKFIFFDKTPEKGIEEHILQVCSKTYIRW